MTTPPERPRATQRSPESDDFPSGPAVGELMPGFALPDQSGALVDFHVARGGKRALVLFVRSARW